MAASRNSAKVWRRVVAAAVLGCAVTVSAQSRFGNWGRTDLPYDGGLTFVRLRWTEGTYGAGTSGRGGRNMWLHEFPRAEQNLMAMLDDFTLVDANTQASLVLTLDDPHLFKHPIALMQEPGFWVMTDEQAERLRAYLLKGGFVIFNDFEGRHWENFEAQMNRVLPGSQWHRLDLSHPIFDAFFRIQRIDIPNPSYHHLFGRTPEYFALYENNDPAGRMMAVANYNTNLAEYWQMGGTGYFPIEPMSVGFELGINYMMYSLTR